MTSPARQLRDAMEPVAAHAFWSPTNRAAMSALGLDFIRGYVCGRAACLGEASPAVVVSTFAWFEPTLISTNYLSGMAITDAATLRLRRAEACAESLSEILHGHDLTFESELLNEAVHAADGVGRPLFAARRELGAPRDPVGRLLWACESLRDFRGDSHTAAVAVAGVDPVEMNLLTELIVGMPIRSYTATRGWSAAAMDEAVARLEQRGWISANELTPDGRQARGHIEADTDRQLGQVIASIGDHLDPLCEGLRHMGELCIAAGAFPDDEGKRAAG